MAVSDFFSQYAPYAQSVSRTTGIDPRIVLAQAALETGYGKSAPNFNLFGIKGKGSTQQTKEFVDGRMVSMPQEFRSYGSPEESFLDYAKLMSGKRYEGVRSGGTLEEQIAALQKSGYATDPDYGKKIMQIAKGINLEGLPMNGNTTQQVGAPLSMNPSQPQQRSGGLLSGLLGGGSISGSILGKLGMDEDQADRFRMAILAGTGDARMAPLIQATQARMQERRGEAKEQRQRNKSLEYLKQRADAGDALAKQYYEAASTGVLPVGAGIAGYLEQMTKVPKVSEAEKQINRLMETGVDRTTAIAIRDGRLKISRNPVTQRAELIDMATGGTVGQAPEALAQEVGAEGAAPADDRFKGLPVTQAGGLAGWGAGIVNTVTDALGAGQQFPNIGEAQAAMKDLSTRTVLMLDADFAGKPTNFTRQKLEELTVKPSEVTQGSAQSYQKTVNMISALEEAMAGAKAAINNPSQYSPQKVREAESSVSKLQGLLDDYTSLKNAFENKGLASQGAANGQPTVVQTDQDRALIQKYSNPNYIRDNMLPSPE
jgi:hypothetical protein